MRCKEDKKLNRPRIFKTLATDPVEEVTGYDDIGLDENDYI